MKYLVTGGAGFIGTNFIKLLLNKYPDCQIINLDKLTYAGNLANLEDIANDPRYTFVRGDITDAELVETLMPQVDVVVHFAAESHVDRSILDSATFVKTNVLGTQVLLEAARRHGNKRFHHVSTDEVFGSLKKDDPKFNETTPYDPRSPYSASKAGSDHLVRAYYHTHGLPITISNCSNNYGPYQFPEKLIPLFINNLRKGEQVPVYGDGQQIRDWLYVEDHCTAIDLIINKGQIGETYCIGGECEKANLEITEKLIELLGRDASAIKHVEDRKGHDRRYAIDINKIHNELGWSPTMTFDEGMKKTVEWYLAHTDWVENITSGEYQKYYEKQYENRGKI